MKIALFLLSSTEILLSDNDVACLCELLSKRWESAEIEVLDYPNFSQIGKVDFLKHLKNLSPDIFALGVYSLRVPQRIRIRKMMALVTSANKKIIIDLNGNICFLSWFRFLILDIPLAIIEYVFAPFVLIKHLFRIKFESFRIGKKYSREINDLKNLVYLRTNFAFNLKSGGSVGHTAGVISGLLNCGFDIRIMSTDELLGIDKTKVLTDIVYPRHIFGILTGLMKLDYNDRFIRKCSKILNGRRIDLLYQRYSIFSYAGVTLARKFHVPFILEFNSSEVWKEQNWSGKNNRLLYMIKRIEMLNLIAADMIVVVSEPLKKDLIGWGIDGEKILVNPNGVDPIKFDAALSNSGKAKSLKRSFGINDSDLVVGFTGTFGIWHGIPQLTQAIEEILGKRLVSNIHFLLIGDGLMKGEMERELSHYKNVTFTGQIPYSDIQYYIAFCDILVSPHNPQIDGNEFFGSPTKLYEYMAMGKGIVASDLGQIGKVLKNRVTGYLVKPGDVSQLIEGIVDLIQNRELRLKMGENARLEAIGNYTWDINTKRVINRLKGLN